MRLLLVFLFALASASVAAQTVGPVIVHGAAAAITYHYDNLRTGWNNHETALTPQNVNATTFGLLRTIAVDDQVDAQPLVVPGGTLPGLVNDVIYVATENNTVYAIDSSTGAVLVSRNLGAPVPWPLQCNNNGPNVGINSTPVIDLATQTLYVMTYLSGAAPTYQLHALNLGNLTDRAPPVTVAASHTLTNGNVWTFDATSSRQRAGLIEINGNVYAAFSSFCDFKYNVMRGLVLGWNAKTLSPLPGNLVTDTQSSANFLLSGIWMSGYGIAGDSTGLYFSTGNSQAGTYDGVTSIQNSVVGVSSDLVHLRRVFTPSNVAVLDAGDTDLASGGVLLLPPQSGAYPLLAVAGGKDGRIFLLNRNNNQLGGYAPFGPDNALDIENQTIGQSNGGGCWCGPSFFTGPDGVGRVVTSEGVTLNTWRLVLTPTPHLQLEGAATLPQPLRDPGFLTSVSSNGVQAGTAVLWVALGPQGGDLHLTLYAFNATAQNGSLPPLYSSNLAGFWQNTGGNNNTVPVVANGKVYVVSNKQLAIFGLLPGKALLAPDATQFASNSTDRAVEDAEGPKAAAEEGRVPSLIIDAAFVAPAQVAAAPINNAAPETAASAVTPPSPHLASGILKAIDGSTLTLQDRHGKIVKIDDTEALRSQLVPILTIGEAYTVQGSLLTGTGALRATAIGRAKGTSGEAWPPDR